MAMPTRSARRTVFEDTTPTPANIGPGSYEQLTKDKVMPSYTGFGTGERRCSDGSSGGGGGRAGKTKQVTPGPGEYDVGGMGSGSRDSGGGEQPQDSNQNQRRRNTNPPVQRSACFSSKSARIAPQYTGSSAFAVASLVEVPGPGAYNAGSVGGSSSGGGAGGITGGSRPGRGEGQRGKPPRRRQQQSLIAYRFNPPAIPARGQSFGYDQGWDGDVRPLEAPTTVRSGEKGDTAGPGDYENLRKEKHRSTKICMDERKTVFDREWACHEIKPGPGQYDPNIHAIPQVGRSEGGGSGQHASSCFANTVPKQAPASDTPGPGAYRPEGQGGGAMGTGAGAGTKSTLQCFGSTSRRGAWLREAMGSSSSSSCPVPGPGAYGGAETGSSFAFRPQKTLLDEPVSFSSTAQRPVLSNNGDARPNAGGAGAPGPGQYDMWYSTLAGNVYKMAHVGRLGAFGTRDARFRETAPKAEVPKDNMQAWNERGQAPVKKVVTHPNLGTSPFRGKAGTGRGPTANLQKDHLPPACTSYDVKGEFDQIKALAEEMKRRRAAAAQALSQTQQQAQQAGGGGEGGGGLDQNGPAGANLKGHSGHTHTTGMGLSSFGAGDRFKGGAFDSSDKEELPGPGAYIPRDGSKCSSNRGHTSSQWAQGSRFPGTPVTTPVGPGAYELGGSLSKKSFNITFSSRKASRGRGGGDGRSGGGEGEMTGSGK